MSTPLSKLPPPPPLPSVAPPPAAASPVAPPQEGLSPRLNRRSALPDESPGRLVLPDLQSLYVTVHDISRGGCCVIRKGNLALQPGDKVRIEIWRENIQTKASLPAIVRWVREEEECTHAGLRFIDTSVKTQRLVDDYIRRSLTPSD